MKFAKIFKSNSFTEHLRATGTKNSTFSEMTGTKLLTRSRHQQQGE